MQNPYFNKAKEKAENALKDESRIQSILKLVGQKLNAGNLEISKMGSKLNLMVRMVKAYISGQYKVIPWKSIIIIVAVLIYFIMPLDLIADFIPITGYVDDFSLIIWAFNHLKDDIDTFEWWEQNGNA